MFNPKHTKRHPHQLFQSLFLSRSFSLSLFLNLSFSHLFIHTQKDTRNKPSLTRARSLSHIHTHTENDTPNKLVRAASARQSMVCGTSGAEGVSCVY